MSFAETPDYKAFLGELQLLYSNRFTMKTRDSSTTSPLSVNKLLKVLAPKICLIVRLSHIPQTTTGTPKPTQLMMQFFALTSCKKTSKKIRKIKLWLRNARLGK